MHSCNKSYFNMRILVCIVLCAMFAVVVYGQLTKVNERPITDDMKKMTFRTPTLSEEDSHSNFLPAELKCDACRVVAYQFHTKFTAFIAKNKQFKSKLPESELILLVEDVCNHETYKNYGLKEVDEVRRLTGEGLETMDAPGVISGGGRWPGRLEQMCLGFIEELGEEDIYDLYLKNSASIKTFEDQLCRGKGVLGECSKQKKTGAEKKYSKRMTKEL